MSDRIERTVNSNRYVRMSLDKKLVRVLYVHVNANENMKGQPLHEVHGVTVNTGKSVTWWVGDPGLSRVLNTAADVHDAIHASRSYTK